MSDRFVDVDGSKVYIREWKAVTPKAHVLFVHGLGEHCSRYDSLFNKFADVGVSVTAFDLPGHGDTLKNNPRQVRGHIESLALVYKILDFLSLSAAENSFLVFLCFD